MKQIIILITILTLVFGIQWISGYHLREQARNQLNPVIIERQDSVKPYIWPETLICHWKGDTNATINCRHEIRSKDSSRQSSK